MRAIIIKTKLRPWTVKMLILTRASQSIIDVSMLRTSPGPAQSIRGGGTVSLPRPHVHLSIWRSLLTQKGEIEESRNVSGCCWLIKKKYL